jgi:hypothetical protein
VQGSARQDAISIALLAMAAFVMAVVALAD